ncbi:glycosyltransferase [Dictyobacter aurantiacus]|uniref:Glycosyl transferase family 1 n=1 Tax=Dictyobacter aurantiacus TaxID=1936993 RepID=A0A401Z7D4_9CHLR|nr:glycosyltransferase [Dictyobacter aurantiacus]GCE02754.1 glycosyl transferase family 1 [Dictyobacter aurantiacus]
MCRIAFLSEHANPLAARGGADAGGQNVYISELCQQLAQRGYQVDVFTRRDTPDGPEIINWLPGIRVISVQAGPTIVCPKDSIWPFMHEFMLGILAFLTREQRQYDLIHSNFWMSGWVAVELKRRLTLPVVHIFHAMGKTKQRNQGTLDSSPAERLEIEQYVINGVDRIIAQCPEEQRELIEDYDTPAHKVAVIPSAVNINVFSPVDCQQARHTIGFDSDDFIVVYVGRLLPRKDVRNVVRGVAHLVELVRRDTRHTYPGIKFLIVGGETDIPSPLHTPEIAVLQELAADLHIDDVLHFIGKRQQEMLRYYYSAGNVVVTTPWYEPFGLTPLEGMACGRPVIGSAVGGITYTIADGITGFHVPAKDPAALARKLFQLFLQPSLGIQMGHAARQRVEQLFSWHITAQRTGELYNEVLSETQISSNFTINEYNQKKEF